MNDTLKTLIFVLVAAVAAFAGWMSKPSAPTEASLAAEVRGQPLYPKWKTPLDVAAIDITQYNEKNGAVSVMQVVRQNEKVGKNKYLWQIPSHENYPADADTQVASLPASMFGLKIIDMVSETDAGQKEFGVVEPNSEKVEGSGVGIGDKVVMRDESGKDLFAVVIGKEVQGNSKQRYVRKVGESPIYVVEINTSKITTKFEDWIEPNLLDIKMLDMKQLRIDDYSVQVSERTLDMKGRMVLDYDTSKEPHWKLVADQKFSRAAKKMDELWVDRAMAANEEVDATKLDDFRMALSDLKIVDVRRKPKGISADLKLNAGLTFDRETQMELFTKGFFLGPLSEGGPVELLSCDGEFRIAMNDGAQYILRFGTVAGASSLTEKGKKDAGKNGDQKSAEKSGDKLDRYLLVMAEFNEKIVKKPDFLALPEPPKEEPAAKSTSDKSTEKNDKKKDDTKKDDTKKDDKDAKGKKDAKNEPKPRTAKEKYEDSKYFIEKENKRLQEEYERQIADGRKHVEKLNARFADWYYIIPGDVYAKIHLSRSDIIKKKTPKAKSGDAGDESGKEHAGHDHDKPNLKLEK